MTDNGIERREPTIILISVEGTDSKLISGLRATVKGTLFFGCGIASRIAVSNGKILDDIQWG